MKYKDLRTFILNETKRLEEIKQIKPFSLAAQAAQEQSHELRKILISGIDNPPDRPVATDPLIKGLATLINSNLAVLNGLRKAAKEEN